jgi:hypothetical protein
MKIPTRAVGEWWNHPSGHYTPVENYTFSTTIPRKNNQTWFAPVLLNEKLLLCLEVNAKNLISPRDSSRHNAEKRINHGLSGFHLFNFFT